MDLYPAIIGRLSIRIFFWNWTKGPRARAKNVVEIWSNLPVYSESNYFHPLCFPAHKHVTLRYCYVRNNESSGLSKSIYFAIGLRGLLQTTLFSASVTSLIHLYLQPLYKRSHFIPLLPNSSHNFGPRKLKFGYVPRAN